MLNPVTIDDIEQRWRPFSTAEEGLFAQSLLDDAWSILNAQVPTIEARLTDATLSTDLVVTVVSAMVLRVLRNPEGKRSETIDDYSYTRDNTVAAGALYLAPDELALLSGTTGGAFTITPYGAPDTLVADPYWPG